MIITVNDEVIRDIISGRKTQIRKAICIPTITHKTSEGVKIESLQDFAQRDINEFKSFVLDKNLAPCLSGDVLHVRKTYENRDYLYSEIKDETEDIDINYGEQLKIKVTDVKIARLQDINGTDVMNEGINPQWYNGEPERWENEQRTAYMRLWNNINHKKYKWSENPWVWVIHFEKIKGD